MKTQAVVVDSKRNSSIELFRLLAAFMVVLTHFNGWFVGDLPEKFSEFSEFRITQAIIQACTCICVNSFLVISGWFGLRFRFRHVFTIWSTLFFLNLSLSVLNWFLKGEFLYSLSDILAIGGESYFVNCYLMLMVMAPMFNSFIEKFGKRILLWVMLLWSIEFIWSFYFKNKCLGFNDGYGLTHFILMYFLGRTAYLYRDWIFRRFSDSSLITIYIGGVIILLLGYYFWSLRIMFYVSPVNIVMTFALFLFFARRSFRNKFIDFFAGASLMIYMFHVSGTIKPILEGWDIVLLRTEPYFTYLALTICIVFGIVLTATLLDKVRIVVMTPVANFIVPKIDKIGKSLFLE